MAYIKRFLLFIIVLGSIASLGIPVLAAPPGLPAVFYGTVHIASEQAPEDAVVRAYVEGVESGQTPVVHDPQNGAVYVINVFADDPETPGVLEGGRLGDRVTFAVELPGGGTHQMIQDGVWQSGMPMELNLDTVTSLTLPLIIRF